MPTNPSIHDLIKDYTNKKPDFTQYTAKRDDEAQRKDDLSKKVEELNLSEEEKQKRERQQFVRDLFRPSKPIISKNKKEDKMPVHPAEENVSGSKLLALFLSPFPVSHLLFSYPSSPSSRT